MSKILQRLFLAAFVILDVVLVAGAMRHVNSTPPSADLPDAAATAAPSPSAGTPSTTDPTPAQVAYEFKASEAVALSASNDGAIVYGTRGRCADPEALVSVSTNGGADFADSKTGLTTTLAVKATNKTQIAVVGTDAGCKVRQVESTDGGLTWKDSGDVDLWYPDVDDASSVVSPDRSSKPGEGCVVTSVSQVTPESARVSCADGTVRGSGDNGATWLQLGRLDNIRVSSFLTPSSGVALARYNGCAANQFATTDGGVTWTPGGCITGDPAQAIAATTNALTAIVANEPYTSTDNGQTWMQP